MSVRRLIPVAVLAICSTNASASPREFYELPGYAALVRPGERLVSLLVDVDCAGVSGVRRLPDGWTAHLVADGESYAVTIVPPGGAAPSGFKDGPPQIALAFRGPWSDCFSVRIEATVLAEGVTRTRVLTPKEFPPSPWIPDADERDNGELRCDPPGTALQWAADYCLAATKSTSLGEPNAARCFRDEPAVMRRRECDAKRNYRLKMCEMAVADGSYPGSVWQCSGDDGYLGPTVRAARPAPNGQAGPPATSPDATTPTDEPR